MTTFFSQASISASVFTFEPRPDLLAAIGIERLLERNLARALEAFAQRRQVVRRSEETIDDARRRHRVGGAEQDFAAAVGMQERRPDAEAVEKRRTHQRKPKMRAG